MGNVNMLLRGGDKVSRRVKRNKILREIWDKYKTFPFIDVSDIKQVLNENGIDVGRAAICSWLRRKDLFGTKGVKKKGRKWVCTKKAFERFMERIAEMDDQIYPHKDYLRKPRKKRESGFKSKRYASLVARGIIPGIR